MKKTITLIVLLLMVSELFSQCRASLLKQAKDSTNYGMYLADFEMGSINNPNLKEMKYLFLLDDKVFYSIVLYSDQNSKSLPTLYIENSKAEIIEELPVINNKETNVSRMVFNPPKTDNYYFRIEFPNMRGGCALGTLYFSRQKLD